MKIIQDQKNIIGLVILILLASILGYLLNPSGGFQNDRDAGKTLSHPKGTSDETKVHIHADFQMYIGDERVRFTDATYQSDTTNIHHSQIHFHDGNDDVIHRHAENVTLVEFFKSIGITITNKCLTLTNGTDYCSNEKDTLQLYVNSVPELNIEKYIFNEEDRILLYYGNPQNANLELLKSGITDEACLYSGTCRERGDPPTEGCGLTCEVTDFTNQPAWWQIW